ncbi:hypothetical protein TorRG33x02_309030 [Trema orientale]|uniref:Uncharacterized protein n=1 Tax=Trema orientale TaxID=63057 RepID=A0A2P5BU19_TREOI|nr:hypothetical protein TorRG33x02_309030 [Trema orientale]
MGETTAPRSVSMDADHVESSMWKTLVLRPGGFHGKY